MKKLKIVLGIGSIIFLASTEAHAFSISVVGAFNDSNPSTGAISGFSGGATGAGASATGFGGGALFGFGGAGPIGFELGALYLPRNGTEAGSDGNNGTYTATIKSTVLEIPALLRFHLGHMFSVGAGAYYALGMGTTTMTMTDAGQSGTAAASTGSDFGLLASAAVTIPLAPTLGIVIDGRYTMGLKAANYPLSTLGGILAGGNPPTMSAKYSDIQVLAGVKIHL